MSDPVTAANPTKEQWQIVRSVLKEGILAEIITLEPKEMKPKAVYENYKNDPNFGCLDYTVKATREKFTRMLRALRKKHGDGDLANEGSKTIEWGKSAAKQHLKKCFREGTINVDYGDAQQVWNDHCDNQRAFANMKCDSAFVRRLASVRDDYTKKAARCQSDLEAYKIAKENHPTPEFNSRGEPQWNGSVAQSLLKEMVARGNHIGKKPQELWNGEKEFQVYSLQGFRDHIYQEERLVKFDNYVALLKKRKVESLQY
jgi:hypothetical protein